MKMRRFKQNVVVTLFSLASAPSFARSVLWDNGETDGIGGASNSARTILEIEIRHVGRKNVGRTES